MAEKTEDKPLFKVIDSSATKVVSLRIPTTDYLRFIADAEKSSLTMSEYIQLKLYAQVKEAHSSDALQLAQAELEKLTSERDNLLLNGTDGTKKLLQVVRELNEAQSEISRLNDLILEFENDPEKEQLKADLDVLGSEKETLIATISELQNLVTNLQNEAQNKENAYNEAAKLLINDIDTDSANSSVFGSKNKAWRDKRFTQFTAFFNNDIEKRNKQPEIEAETNDLPQAK